MATENSGSSNGMLYFIVGALVVGLIVIGYFVMNGRPASTPMERAADAVGDAAGKVGDAAQDATKS